MSEEKVYWGVASIFMGVPSVPLIGWELTREEAEKLLALQRGWYPNKNLKLAKMVLVEDNL